MRAPAVAGLALAVALAVGLLLTLRNHDRWDLILEPAGGEPRTRPLGADSSGGPLPGAVLAEIRAAAPLQAQGTALTVRLRSDWRRTRWTLGWPPWKTFRWRADSPTYVLAAETAGWAVYQGERLLDPPMPRDRALLRLSERVEEFDDRLLRGLAP